MKSGQNLCIKKVKNGFVVTPMPQVGESMSRVFPEESTLIFPSCDAVLEWMKKHFEEKENK